MKNNHNLAQVTTTSEKIEVLTQRKWSEGMTYSRAGMRSCGRQTRIATTRLGPRADSHPSVHIHAMRT